MKWSILSVVSFVFLCLPLRGPVNAEMSVAFSPIIVDTSDTSKLYLFGEITSRMPLNLDRALEKYPEAKTLVLDSHGGDVHAALEGARKIRRNQLTTIVPINSSCYSACSFLFFAGTVRYALGNLGVHQISSEAESNHGSQVGVSDIIDVLDDFDIDPEIYVVMFRTPPEDMYVFTEEEKAQFSLNGRAQNAPTTAAPKVTTHFEMTHSVSGLDPNGDGFLALRTRPNAQIGSRITKMTEGTGLRVLKQQGAWLNVITETGQEGWAHSNWVREIKSASVTAPRSCDDLWFERNSIFAKYGYCFKSERGRQTFSNENCKQGVEAGNIMMPPRERELVESILAKEIAIGCR
ncbi:YARHG domain-containing protein [Halocynthiibacter sp. C4]|uniref:YARHG domain-containing protein n=1 Tax=Halocynthiibacter sp. C4 TaxID=2992758 RepID=UPI00237B6589|nr:YARHG domain-containing protein [Halocynthiibacter sp. C4]MDE0588576.1 YARHG domain-containing protein [Halocynthiibacter sp. C4]